MTLCQERLTDWEDIMTKIEPTRRGRLIGSIIALIAVLFGFAALFGVVR